MLLMGKVTFILLCLIALCSCESKNTQFKNFAKQKHTSSKKNVNYTEQDLSALMKGVEGHRVWQFSGVNCFLDIKYVEAEKTLEFYLESDALNIDDSEEKIDAFRTAFMFWMKQEKDALSKIIDIAAKGDIKIAAIAVKSPNEQLRVVFDKEILAKIQNEEKDEKQDARNWLQSMIAASLLFNKHPETAPTLVGNNLIYSINWSDKDFSLKDISDLDAFVSLYKKSTIENAEEDYEEKYFLYQLFKVCVQGKINIQYHLKEISSGKTVDVIFVQSEMQQYVDENREWMNEYFASTMQR